ncbi:MAG: T9SS type A sorting domain-containing protein [Bacteroidetes bacterium]|nr:T9SS type A sorting domain-containing protein [Bacteroidota bacterium]
MRYFFCLSFLFCCVASVNAQKTLSGKIKVYFTKSVDTSVSKGVYAEQLFKTVDDTLVAYINRAKYSLDIAIYNYTYASTIADIAAAINKAYNRGVKVRIIYDGSVGNTGIPNISASIPKVASPQGSNYNIMHNKFVIVDAKSADANDAIVWTGSANWSNNMFYLDANNVIVIQDKPLALAFRTEFEEMWGDTGMVPNTANSRFGQYKTDNTPHQFVIDGKTVELYFSPSDDTNAKIINSINKADSDLEFCMLQFTRSDIANAIISKAQETGFVAMGLEDPSGLLVGQTVYNNMKTVMGDSLLTDNQSNSILHHKYIIVDQSNSMAAPIVLTGSHNWTTSANTTNDENTLIIHDSTIANVYYQEFVARFKESGGVLSVADKVSSDDITIYPNPGSTEVNISLRLNMRTKTFVKLENILGQVFFSDQIQDQFTNIDVSNFERGMYFLKITFGTTTVAKKILLH